VVNALDLAPIDNEEFGELHMKRLAEPMREDGEYIVYVGSLTIPLHNVWPDHLYGSLAQPRAKPEVL
jgi:simple sugar transport system substrate-binding protein